METEEGKLPEHTKIEEIDKKLKEKFLMKKICIILLLISGTGISVFPQEVLYRVGLHNFFDNTELTGSPYNSSQTMAGVHFAPQIGLGLDARNKIFVGVDAMHEYGSDKAIGYYDPIAYYEFDGKPFRFYMGAFPRSMALDKYPRFFFQDSISNYRPVMTGLFWEYYSEKNDFMNVWLDWTGRQTLTTREAFFMGWSGRYNRGVFYGQHFGYMFHFARTEDAAPDIDSFVHDNGRIWTALGVDLSSKTPFDVLDINAGWAVSLERDRGRGDSWDCPQGLLSEIKVEYRGVGLFNTYYKGGSSGKFYDALGTQLYWSDGFYRASRYDRFEGYIYFLKNNSVTLKLDLSFHFVDAGMFTEQMFTATFDLNNLKNKKPDKKYRYLWENWLK